VSGNDFEITEPVTTQLDAFTKCFVNVGPDEEPLWVDPNEVAAVGIHGRGAMVVLAGSGMQLVAKGKTPSEVAQLLADDVGNYDD